MRGPYGHWTDRITATRSSCQKIAVASPSYCPSLPLAHHSAIYCCRDQLQKRSYKRPAFFEFPNEQTWEKKTGPRGQRSGGEAERARGRRRYAEASGKVQAPEGWRTEGMERTLGACRCRCCYSKPQRTLSGASRWPPTLSAFSSGCVVAPLFMFFCDG